MHKLLAFVRRDVLAASSYRLKTLMSIGSLVVLIVPIYFITGAMQPMMAETVSGQGGEYFAFVVVGLVALRFVQAGAGFIPSAIGSGISSGKLEVLFVTPTRLPTLLAGSMSYGLLWTLLQGAVMLTAASILGAEFYVSRIPITLLLLGLLVAAYLPFGLLAAALILAFRTSGPLLRVVLGASALLGGIYYPTHVIPSWIEAVSAVIPATYALRAMRRVFLEGMPVEAIFVDVGILLGMTALLFSVGVTAFAAALRYARKSGTLAHY